MKLNCILSESDPLRREILEEHISQLPDVHIVARCSNSIETFLALQVQNIDLLFMDIQMPELGGIDLIQCLKKAPLVIFTASSHAPELALKAFELDAVDYLLKPVTFERFLKAIDKVYTRIRSEKQNVVAQAFADAPRKYIFLKSDDGLTRIDYDEVLLVEGLENYVKIHCDSRMITSLNTMKFIENVFPHSHFLRIHRSYIVNMNKVESIRDGCFILRNRELMIGRSYKKTVQSLLKNKYAVKII